MGLFNPQSGEEQARCVYRKTRGFARICGEIKEKSEVRFSLRFWFDVTGIGKPMRLRLFVLITPRVMLIYKKGRAYRSAKKSVVFSECVFIAALVEAGVERVEVLGVEIVLSYAEGSDKTEKGKHYTLGT